MYALVPLWLRTPSLSSGAGAVCTMGYCFLVYELNRHPYRAGAICIIVVRLVVLSGSILGEQVRYSAPGIWLDFFFCVVFFISVLEDAITPPLVENNMCRCVFSLGAFLFLCFGYAVCTIRCRERLLRARASCSTRPITDTGKR